MKENRTETNRRGLLLCVSGPSGTGKGTVIRRILASNPKMVHSIYVTTRPPRQGEQNGVDYHFRSRGEFLSMLDHGDILEHDLYCDHYYGTPKSNIDALLAAGTDVLLDITIPGSLSVMNSYPEAVTIFLMPPSFGELRRRLAGRGTEDPEAMRQRLEKAREEISKAELFTYCIINDDIAAAADKIMAIAQAEHCRYERQKGLEKNILAR